MKFIVQWHSRSGGDVEDNIESGESVLKAFGNWSPPEALSISEFVARVDGRGGLLICESDDLAAVDMLVAQCTAWFDYGVIPVLDVAEGAAQFGEGLAWARQALN